MLGQYLPYYKQKELDEYGKKIDQFIEQCSGTLDVSFLLIIKIGGYSGV